MRLVALLDNADGTSGSEILLDSVILANTLVGVTKKKASVKKKTNSDELPQKY